MEITARSLQWAKQKGIKLVNYNPDNPFVFSGKGSGNRNVTDSIGLYDLHLTYNSAVQKKILEEYKIPAAMLPFGFDISEEVFIKCIADTEIIKLCFLGNPDTYRANFIMQLAERGIQIDVYGNYWDKFLKHTNISIFAPVYGDDFWFVIRKYRVQLNLMRPHNPDTHNMRSFEIPGVGGIQLAPDTNDHRSYFKPGEEIFIYTDIDDCALQARKILSLPLNDAMQIRAAARERSIASGYTYRDKALAVLDIIRSPDA
jgi:spore maturation protein CgeB